MTSGGRLLLWFPGNYISYFLPSKALYSYFACPGGISTSLSPWRKHICLLCGWRLIFSICFLISIDPIYRPDWLSTLHFTQLNTQGKNTWKQQQQTVGTAFAVNYLHRVVRLQYAESAIIMSLSVLLKTLTAPILRPQHTTLYPYPLKYLTAIST